MRKIKAKILVSDFHKLDCSLSQHLENVTASLSNQIGSHLRPVIRNNIDQYKRAYDMYTEYYTELIVHTQDEFDRAITEGVQREIIKIKVEQQNKVMEEMARIRGRRDDVLDFMYYGTAAGASGCIAGGKATGV